MKRLFLLVLLTGFIFSNVLAFAELSVDDLEKIQKLLDRLEERMNKRFTDEVQVLNDKITDQGKHFSDVLAAQGKRLDYLGTLIIAPIVSIIGFVSVPMGLITYQYLKFRSRQDEEIKALREKIQELETKILAENRSQIIQ